MGRKAGPSRQREAHFGPGIEGQHAAARGRLAASVCRRQLDGPRATRRQVKVLVVGLVAFDLEVHGLGQSDARECRKADVVRAIRDGLIDRSEACARYALSLEELCLWERAIDAAGTAGLRVTRVQIYREVFEANH